MTVDLVEVHLTNRIAQLTPEEVDEWARRAVKVFQGMEYLWTSFARVLTGNRSARVVLSAGPSRTDGTTIYYRPPLMLGDPSPHNRNQCDRRDADGHLICPACSVRETVERSITHEIAHRVGGSFQKSSPEQQQTAIRRAVMYAQNPLARAHLESGLRRVQWGDDPQTMMFRMSPFLGLIIMSLEDARIDIHMFKARPGVRKMFASTAKRLSTVGHVDLDGKVVRWADHPLNAQIIIGLLWQAEGFGLGDLHDKVKKDLQDPVLQDICARVDRTGSALEVAALTVECLVRLWELGYCDPPEAMPEPPPYEPPAPPPPPQAEEEPDDKDEPEREEQPSDDSEDQGTSDSDDGSEESPGEDSEDTGADESDPGGGSPGEGDGGTQPEDSSGQSDGDAGEAPGAGESNIPEPGGDGSDSEQDGSQDSYDGEAGSEPSSGPGDQDSDDRGGSGDAGDTGEGGAGSEPQSDSEDGGDDEDDRDGDGGDGGDGNDLGEPGDGQDDGSSGPGDDSGEPGHGEDNEGADGPSAGERSVGAEPESEEGSDTEANTDPGTCDDGSGGEDGGSESTDDTSGGEDDGDSSAEGDRGSEEDEPEQSGPDLDPGSEPGDRDSEAGSGSGDEDPAEDSGEPRSVGDGMGSSDPASAPEGNGAGDEAQGLPDADAPDMAPQGKRDDGSDEAGVDEQPAADLPDAGTAEDVAELIQDLTGHNREDDDPVAVGSTGDDPGLQQAVDKAIVQNQHFDAPSETVSGLHIFEWPKHDGRCEAWARMRQPGELTIRRHDTGRRGEPLWDTLKTSEEILQPALFEMKRVFADNERSRDQRNLKKGRLDGRALGKRAWQREPERLYKRHERPRKRDYAVIIAGDCSWSQHLGKTMVVTKQAMFAQAELLHRMGIPFEVWADTAAYSEEYKRTRENEGYDMIMNQIKSWSDPWNETHQEGLAWLHAVETNLDGHNLEFFRKRLMKTTATNKILLYYTDGEMPAANYSDELDVLKRELETYKRLGITLLGVGIGTNSPLEYGLDTVRVDNKGDITKVVKHLGGVLMDTRR